MRYIRTILFLNLLFITMFPAQGFAASLNVSWNANTETDLAGYKVYYGTQSGAYGSPVDVGQATTCTIADVTGGATYYVAVSAYDTSGNESEKSAQVSASVPVADTTPPTGTIKINSGAATTGSRVVTLNLYATDTQGQVVSMQLSNDGTSYTEAAYASTYQWTLAAGDGVKTVYVRFKDSSGNVSAAVSDAIELLLDTDGDGMPDAWETLHGFNPNSSADASGDTDGDGVSNYNEYLNNTDPANPADNAPVANAGADQNVVPQRVILNGSSSYDPNGDILSYTWAQVSGPATVILETANQNVASFVGIKAGTYSFSLACSDGHQKSTDTVNVVIKNVAPTVDAGADRTINVGSQITLHASGADSNEDTLSYTWTKVSGPSVSLPGLNQQDITFTPTNAGQYTFSVKCSDGVNTSSADQVVVTVNATNSAPTANAGLDQDVNVGALVKLDASGSSDPDGDTLSYTWSQVSGPSVTLSGASTVNATFTASAVGTYVFRLVVSDGKVSSTADQVTVRVVSQNTPPVASAGNDIRAFVGDDVILDASGSYDPDNDGLSFTWSQVSGAVVQIHNANTMNAFFTPTTSGVFEFKVSVTDGQATSTDTMIVTVDNANQVPVADAGEAVVALVGQSVTLDGSGSYDPDGDAISYVWSQASGPVVTLSASNSVRPSFVVSQAGVYVFELRVYDGKDTSGASSVTVTVQNKNTEVTLLTPSNGQACYSSPTLSWTGEGFKSYKAYISIDGKKYSNVYSGSGTSATLHSVLWRWFIPAGTTVRWYVDGTTAGGVTVKSSVQTFIRR
jgi:hypothetical protein